MWICWMIAVLVEGAASTVSHRSRLNDAYAQRVAGLERAVTVAQRQLDQAFQARNALL